PRTSAIDAEPARNAPVETTTAHAGARRACRASPRPASAASAEPESIEAPDAPAWAASANNRTRPTPASNRPDSVSVAPAMPATPVANATRERTLTGSAYERGDGPKPCDDQPATRRPVSKLRTRWFHEQSRQTST